MIVIATKMLSNLCAVPFNRSQLSAEEDAGALKNTIFCVRKPFCKKTVDEIYGKVLVNKLFNPLYCV